MDPPVSEPRPSGAKPGRHGGGGAAAAAAGHLADVARVARRARRPSSPSSCPWRTRPCSSCPARPRPASAQARHHRGVVGRAPPFEDPRPARRGVPRVHRLSFSATGTPASGPGSRPAATAASTASAWARASSPRTARKAVQLAVARRHRGQRLLGDLARRPLARRAPRRPGPRHADVTAPRSPMRGTRKRWSSTAGAAASTSSRSRLGRGSSGRSTFSSAIGCDDGARWDRSSAATSAAWSSTVRSWPVKSSTSSSVRSRRARRATWTTSSRLSEARPAARRSRSGCPAVRQHAGEELHGARLDLVLVVVQRGHVVAPLEDAPARRGPWPPPPGRRSTTGSTTWSCVLVKTRTGQVTDSSRASTSAAAAKRDRAARRGSPG